MNVQLEQVQKMLDWLKTKLYLDSQSLNARTRVIRRGEVYRCNFGRGIGSEIQKERPAVVIQNNAGNNHSGNTVVIPITHDTSTLPCVANIMSYKDDEGNVILDGQANASNIMCVSKARLGEYICKLSPCDMKMIDEAVAKTIGLMGYYSDLTKKLEDKQTYIQKLKSERNAAQDEVDKLKIKLKIMLDNGK